MNENKIIIDVLINKDFYDKALMEAGYYGYEDWLRARHDELCEGIISAYLKNSKEISRLKRLDRNVKRSIQIGEVVALEYLYK